jgi:hypothetical protein
MALGVTHQLPMEERHIHPRDYIEDSLCVRMGGRVAELLVYGDLSTGAANDLVGNTELARKMVREWGMSDAIGPMAWGSAGQVFLGDDLMHTRDYSEDTSKIIDGEVERILRVEEGRAMDVLSKHRGGLNAIARALLDNEIIDGAEVARLVDEAHGSPVHTEGSKSVPHFDGATIGASAGNGAGTSASAGGNANASGNGHHPVTDGSPGHENGHEHGQHPVTDGSPAAGQGQVAVPGHAADTETWAPPPWPPPANPAAGAPEGPVAR